MKDMINILLTAAALGIPAWACFVLGRRLRGNKEASWQTIACFTALAVTTSLLFLLVAGQIEILRYGETQVNRKLDEVKSLRDEVRAMANANAELSVHLALASIYPFGKYATFEHWQGVRGRISGLLTQSGASASDQRQILKQFDAAIEELKKESTPKP